MEGKEICPYKSEIPFYCGPGFEVIDNSRYGSVNDCRSCPPGTFSGYTSTTCEPCRPGYVCKGETNRAKPTDEDNHRGYKCPKGHYCPEGTSVPKECKPGFFNPLEGMQAQTDCQMCAPGTFQDLYG